MRVLGINAVCHDPAAALIVDGRIVAADPSRGGPMTVSLFHPLLLLTLLLVAGAYLGVRHEQWLWGGMNGVVALLILPTWLTVLGP